MVGCFRGKNADLSAEAVVPYHPIVAEAPIFERRGDGSKLGVPLTTHEERFENSF